MTNYRYLNQPLTVRGKTIKNRVVVPPMADFGMTGTDGLVNDRHIERYGAYAKGGAGLIVIEACAVSKMPEPRNTIGLFSDECLPGLAKLAAAAKQNGAVALVQIMETGLETMRENTIAEIPAAQFEQYKNDFISAAVRCQKAGFDGVELHAAHGMYLDEIIETSTRTDGYGGSFENRLRILPELIQKIKAACGENFIVAVRFGNPDLDQLVQTAHAIERAGGDLLDVSTGMGRYTAPNTFNFDGKIYAASLVKKAASLPVICVGNITQGEQAEQILQSGYADMAAVGRGYLCDPAWANKVLAGQPPVLCWKCRYCMWYNDGRRCPARRNANGGEA